MSDEHDEPQVRSGSVWAHLRARHKTVTDEPDPLYLDDPVHAGVVYRYGYVPLGDEKTKKAAKKLAKIPDPTDQSVAGAADTLILALQEIMITASDGEIPTGREGRELYSLPVKALADPGQPPIRFDEQLCAGMGFPANVATHASSIVREMFGHNDYLLIEHAREVSAWIAEVGMDVREAYSEALGKA